MQVTDAAATLYHTCIFIYQRSGYLTTLQRRKKELVEIDTPLLKEAGI